MGLPVGAVQVPRGLPPAVGEVQGSRRVFLAGALARELRVDIRQLKRWRKGTRPDPGNLIALFGLAAGMGLLHLLLPEAVMSEV